MILAEQSEKYPILQTVRFHFILSVTRSILGNEEEPLTATVDCWMATGVSSRHFYTLAPGICCLPDSLPSLLHALVPWIPKNHTQGPFFRWVNWGLEKWKALLQLRGGHSTVSLESLRLPWAALQSHALRTRSVFLGPVFGSCVSTVVLWFLEGDAKHLYPFPAVWASWIAWGASWKCTPIAWRRWWKRGPASWWQRRGRWRNSCLPCCQGIREQ